MKVEVVYASVTEQMLLEVELEKDASVQQAIKKSGLLQQFPEINLDTQTVGIFSRRVNLEHLLQAGDRVEIYRPLTIDPKDARMARVKAERDSGAPLK